MKADKRQYEDNDEPKKIIPPKGGSGTAEQPFDPDKPSQWDWQKRLEVAEHIVVAYLYNSNDQTKPPDVVKAAMAFLTQEFSKFLPSSVSTPVQESSG